MLSSPAAAHLSSAGLALPRPTTALSGLSASAAQRRYCCVLASANVLMQQKLGSLFVGPATFLLQQCWAGPNPWRYMSVPHMAAHYQRSRAARIVQKELRNGAPPALLHPQPSSVDILVRAAYALPAWQTFKACMQVRLQGECNCG